MYFSKNLERKIGLSSNDIKRYSPEKFRSHIENLFQKKTVFVSEFPYIGRGNVLGDGLLSTCAINKEVDSILFGA
jgi:hypothetical protein